MRVGFSERPTLSQLCYSHRFIEGWLELVHDNPSNLEQDPLHSPLVEDNEWHLL